MARKGLKPRLVSLGRPLGVFTFPNVLPSVDFTAIVVSRNAPFVGFEAQASTTPPGQSPFYRR